MSSDNYDERRSEYHLVFVSKCRFKMLKRIEIKSICEQAFREVECKLELKIRELNLQSDHVHMLITILPMRSVSEVVKRLKGVSASAYFKLVLTSENVFHVVTSRAAGTITVVPVQ